MSVYVDPDVIEELSRYDEAFAPRPGRRAGLEVLPDGGYDFEVVGAELGRTEKSREAILRVGLRVLGGPRDGQEVERAYLLTGQQSCDMLGSDLATLGFDAVEWTTANRRPFAAELGKAVPRLAGVRFRGTKSEKKEGTKTYQNLFVNARLAGGGGGAAPPAAVARGPATGAPFSRQPAPSRTPISDEIPF